MATWPAESDWIAATVGGQPITDVCGDAAPQDYLDLVGDAANPAAFWYSDGTNLWFRIRLMDSPSMGAKWRETGWGVLVESDWDAAECSFDFLVYVDGKSEFVRVTDNLDGSRDWALDNPEAPLLSYPAPMAPSGDASAGNAGYAQANTDVCGGTAVAEDWTLDWYVPWADLQAAVGVGPSTPIGLVYATSTSLNQFDKDRAGCDDLTGLCNDWCELVGDEIVPEEDAGPGDTDGGDTDGDDTDGIDTDTYTGIDTDTVDVPFWVAGGSPFHDGQCSCATGPGASFAWVVALAVVAVRRASIRGATSSTR